MTSLASERVSALQQYGVLTEPPGRDLQALVELAAQIFDVPTAVINIITDDEQHQIAATGMEASVCAREDSMCAAVLEHHDVVAVADAPLDDRFRDNPFVTGAIGSVRFYASAPLVTGEGVVLGRICVFDLEPREVSERESAGLQVLADRVVDILELRLRSRTLEQSLRELTRARNELHRSNERLALFAGQVSHDLRTPLTAMVLNTEVALHEPAVQRDDYLAELLGNALGAGHRMTALVDGMLESARLDGTRNEDVVDLTAVLDAVLEDLRPTLEKRHADVAAGFLPCVHGDRAALYSVLLNLLSNAVKFTPPERTPRISVRSSSSEDAWRIEVTDNGTGVPADDADRLFELFARDGSGAPGTGIGLATVKDVVTRHGGTVGLEPGEGLGTRAWFTLPRTTADFGVDQQVR